MDILEKLEKDAICLSTYRSYNDNYKWRWFTLSDYDSIDTFKNAVDEYLKFVDQSNDYELMLADTDNYSGIVSQTLGYNRLVELWFTLNELKEEYDIDLMIEILKDNHCKLDADDLINEVQLYTYLGQSDDDSDQTIGELAADLYLDLGDENSDLFRYFNYAMYGREICMQNSVIITDDYKIYIGN